MTRALVMVIMVIALPAWGHLRSHEAGEPAANGDELPRLLEQLDRVASLYRDTALKFSCDEKIVLARPGSPSQFYEFEYVYEFSKTSGLVDFRVDKRAPHPDGKVPPPARLSDYDLPYFLLRGYSWVFLVDRAHQSRHTYSVGARTSVLGRPAIPLTFEPVPPYESDHNDWFGTLWVDAELLQPLRVEAIKQIEREKEEAFRDAVNSTGALEKGAKKGWDFAHVETEFTEEENDMRFPGRVMITGIRGRVRINRGKRVAEERTLFTVSQRYSNYRFFGVKTLEQIRDIVQEDTTR